MDIASLGFSIDTTDVKKAESDLDGLTKAGTATEQAAAKVGSAWGSAAAKMEGAAAPASKVGQSFKQNTDELRKQQAELSQLIGKIDPVVGALGRLDDMEQQLRAHRSAGLLGQEDFSLYAGKIDTMRKSLTAADGDLKRTGNTAAQTAQALRLLPAQFTDIATGLASGQSPFTVLLQQGGQLKDSFGGIAPAVRAVGGYVTGLINPFTLAAAAAAALALAYKQGSDEATAYTKALIESGNAAGTSADQLATYAAQIDGGIGTTSAAADALTQLAATGKIAEAQLVSLATAAVAWEKATGTAVSDTVAEFKKLAEDPVTASQKLNEQYNYLTSAVYEQISALEDQGRTNEAAALAETTYANALNERANKIQDSLGTIETAWNAVKSAASEAWDAALNVGREQTLDERIAELRQQLQELSDIGTTGPKGRARFQLGAGDGGNREAIQQELITAELQKEQEAGQARFAAESTRINQESIAAQREISSLRESTLTKAEQKEKAIADYWANVAKVRAADPFTNLFSQEQIDKDLAGIDAKFAERQKKARSAAPKAVTDDAATKMLQTLREQGAALDLQLSTNEKLTASQREQVKFQQLIADLKSKDILTADQKSLLANQDVIKAQLDRNVALEDEVRLKGELQKLDERSQQLQASISAGQANRDEQQQRLLDAFGQGKQANERAQSEGAIFREFRRYQDELDKATPKDLLGSDQYKKAAGEIRDSLQDALAANEAYYDKLSEKQKDWKNGANEAFADYIDSAKNVSDQTYDLFSNAFSGLEDVFVEFAKTGKLSFSDLADSIIADIARIGARQLTANLAEGLFSSLGSLSSGGGKSSGITSKGQNGDSTSSLLSLFSSFAGLFDAGGDIAAGQWGIVGEKGPEIVRGPVSVTGREKTARMSASNTQVFNMSFPDIRDAREARQATATAARQFGQVAAGTARYQ